MSFVPEKPTKNPPLNASVKKVLLGQGCVNKYAINNFPKNFTDVFIEFPLPQDTSYGIVLNYIKLDIVDWATRYNIPYTQKTIKYTHRLAFDQDQHYTVFATTWNSKMEYRLIDRQW